MNKNTTPNTTLKQKWSTFTYTGKETRTITRLLKNINLRIAYKTRNTVQNHLRPRDNTTDIYSKSGIYQMKCNSCQRKYVGQTGRNFRTRCREHTQAIRSNKPISTYAQHAYSTMDILHIERKCPMMNTWERYHIYNLYKDNLHISDKYTDTHNPIFNVIKDHYENSNAQPQLPHHSSHVPT
jgi:hypothetical protein